MQRRVGSDPAPLGRKFNLSPAPTSDPLGLFFCLIMAFEFLKDSAFRIYDVPLAKAIGHAPATLVRLIVSLPQTPTGEIHLKEKFVYEATAYTKRQQSPALDKLAEIGFLDNFYLIGRERYVTMSPNAEKVILSYFGIGDKMLPIEKPKRALKKVTKCHLIGDEMSPILVTKCHLIGDEMLPTYKSILVDLSEDNKVDGAPEKKAPKKNRMTWDKTKFGLNAEAGYIEFCAAVKKISERRNMPELLRADLKHYFATIGEYYEFGNGKGKTHVNPEQCISNWICGDAARGRLAINKPAHKTMPAMSARWDEFGNLVKH